jgi:hypothetical protein
MSQQKKLVLVIGAAGAQGVPVVQGMLRLNLTFIVEDIQDTNSYSSFQDRAI